MIQRFRTTATAAAAVLIAALAGCGVKNAPVAPATNQVPAGANAGPAPRANDAVVDPIFEPANDDDGAFIRSNPVAARGDDDTIGTVEPSRNPAARDRGFLLDPLLN